MQVPTFFDSGVIEWQNSLSQNKADVQGVEEVRLYAVMTTVAAAALGAIWTLAAIGSFTATFGFSAVLLVPAAAFLLIAHEAFRITRCCDILLRSAEQRMFVAGIFRNVTDVGQWLVTNGPQWYRDLRAEVNATLLLRMVLYQTDEV